MKQVSLLLLDGVDYLQPIRSMWNNTTENTESYTLTFNDRGSGIVPDRLNCYPLPPPSRFMGYPNVAGTETVYPFLNQGNRRFLVKPFMIYFKMCNVHVYPISVQVHTIAWSKLWSPFQTDNIRTEFLDGIFESTYAVQSKFTAGQTTNQQMATPDSLDLFKFHNQTVSVEAYGNDNGATSYALQWINPDWNSANMRNKFKLLVRRKRVLIPPGGMYTFAVKMRPPRILRIEDLTTPHFHNKLDRLLMVTMSSECGARAATDVSTIGNQYANVTLSDPLVLPVIAKTSVKGQMQYVWPKVHMYGMDTDLIGTASGTAGQQVGMNASAQAVNLQP